MTTVNYRIANGGTGQIKAAPDDRAWSRILGEMCENTSHVEVMASAQSEDEPYSYEVLIPPTLARAVQRYLDKHPSLSFDDVVMLALAMLVIDSAKVAA